MPGIPLWHFQMFRPVGLMMQNRGFFPKSSLWRNRQDIRTSLFKYIRVPSVSKGIHALNHDIWVIFCVVLNRRTSKYASIVRLENRPNIYGQGRRVGKKPIFVPARRLTDAYWTYAEGKQRSRSKNWFFSDRVFLCSLRVMNLYLYITPMVYDIIPPYPVHF